MDGLAVTNFIHVLTAVVTAVGIIVRGIWMMQTSPMLANKGIKIGLHINDTILLLTAIILVMLTAQYPGPVAWINMKIIALVLYMFFAAIALKRGKSRKGRIIAWCVALLLLAYIFLVALSKTAMPI